MVQILIIIIRDVCVFSVFVLDQVNRLLHRLRVYSPGYKWSSDGI